MKMARIAIAVTVLLGLIGDGKCLCGRMLWGNGGRASVRHGTRRAYQRTAEAGGRSWTELLKKQEQLRAELGNKRIELMELAQKDSPDEQSVEKKRQEIWSLQDAMRNEARTLDTKFRAILTPEQRQKLGPVRGMGCGGCGGPRVGNEAGCAGCPWSISSRL